jgi:hypothetical protein
MGIISDPAVEAGDFVRHQKDQQAQIEATRTARKGEHTSVTSGTTRFSGEGGVVVDGGGDLEVLNEGDVVIDGGVFRLRNPDGVQVVFLGPVGTSETGFNSGFVFAYASGAHAISLGGDVDGQLLRIRDTSGGEIFANDVLSGHGIARPYLGMRIVPAFSAESAGEGALSLWPSTTSGTAVKLMQGINPIEQPRLAIGVAMNAIGDGTAHYRLDINGVTVIADETTTGSQTVNIPGWGTTINPGDAVGIDLYGWVTGGTSPRMWLQCDRLHGTKS